MAITDIIQRFIPTIIDNPGKLLLLDETSSSFAYVGLAEAGSLTSAASWLIYRIYRQGTVYTIEVAPGGAYDKVWNSRTTYFGALTLNNTYSLGFDGANDYLDIGNNYTFEHSTAFSISLWIKPQNLAATRCLFSKASNDANVYGYNLAHDTAGRLTLQLRATGALTSFQFNLASAITAGVWQHVVLTYSGGSNISGARYYRNASVADTPSSAGLSGTWTNTASLTVGSRNTGLNFSGHIDEVSVWDKALSASEVTEIYNSGQPGNLADHSAYNNLLSWWRMGDGDTYPTILDNKSTKNGTMTNMTSGSIEADVP